MTLPTPSASQDGEIEVGNLGDSLRYWLAKEALRQGELGLTSQMSALDAMMSRASAIFGWSVTVTIALVGIASLPGGPQFPAFAALVCAFRAAVFCVCALWPRNWALNGYDPVSVINQTYGTELEVLESMAKGLAEAKRLNGAASQRVGIFLRLGWLCFCLSPVAGLAPVAVKTWPHF